MRRKDSAPETYDFSGIIGSPLHAGADKKMVHEFLDSVTSGKTTRTDLSSALKSHLICIS